MSLLRTDGGIIFFALSPLPALNRFFSHHNIHRTCSLAGVLFVSNRREHVVLLLLLLLLLRTCITYYYPIFLTEIIPCLQALDRLEQNERFSCNSISFPTNPWFYCPTHCWTTFNFSHCCWTENHLQTALQWKVPQTVGSPRIKPLEYTFCVNRQNKSSGISILH